MTTASAANSKVLSMPLNALLESAALPSGPVMWTAMPAAPAWAIDRSESAAGAALFQPLEPRLTSATVWMALPSVEKVGPVILPGRTPDTCLNLRASAAALVLSAGVRPDGRLYTTTAGYTFGEMNSDRRLSTCVDSAFGGSHAELSFFSAPVSFPESGPMTATRISQPTSTSHLVRRPAGTFAIARKKLTPDPPVSPCDLVIRTSSHGEVHRTSRDFFQQRYVARPAAGARPSMPSMLPKSPRSAYTAVPRSLAQANFRPKHIESNLVRVKQINSQSLKSTLEEAQAARAGPGGQKLPRRSCSRSMASNSALKFPLPKPSEPCRSMNSKKTVGRSPIGLVKICSRYPSSSLSTRMFRRCSSPTGTRTVPMRARSCGSS